VPDPDSNKIDMEYIRKKGVILKAKYYVFCAIIWTRIPLEEISRAVAITL
jgi:hypothetical protein